MLLLFRRICLEEKHNKSLNQAATVSFLNQCGKLRRFAEGKRLHAQIINSRIEEAGHLRILVVQMYGRCGALPEACLVFKTINDPNIFAWNTILTVYATHGYLKKACEIFELIPIKNEISWTVLISAYSQQDRHNEALVLFWQMQSQGFRSDKVTLVTILDTCASGLNLAAGKQVHAFILAIEFQSDVMVDSSLINMYGKCGSVQDAVEVFGKMHCPNEFSWSATIAAYAQNEELDSAWQLLQQMPGRDVVSWNVVIGASALYGSLKETLLYFRQMQFEGMTPNRITLASITNASACQTALSIGKHIHAIIIKGRLESDVMVGATLVNMYGENLCLDDAEVVFDRTLKPDTITWSTMIKVFAQNGHPEKALELFHQLQMHGLVPDKVTFVVIIEDCASYGVLDVGKHMHAQLLVRGFESDLAVGNALVNMYGKCGSLADAERLFDKMTRREVTSWNSMLGVYALHAKAGKVYELFHQMQQARIVPDKVTFVTVLDICAMQGALCEGQKVHLLIQDCKLESDVIVGTALINIYGKCGLLEPLHKLFEAMPSKNIATWTAMVGAYTKHGHVTRALGLIQEMKLEGVMPNEITFSTLLSACSHSGFSDECCHCFVSMAFLALEDHCNCIIDMFGRLGQYDDAQDFLNSMPFQPSVTSQMSLLGVCRPHKVH